MPPFATPSASHESIPKGKRYCTNCRRDVTVAVGDDVCPTCHEKSFLPPAQEQRHDSKTI